MSAPANSQADTPGQLKLLKRQFLAALNHEIRTPLSGILGMTSLLEQSPLNSEQKEFVALTKACAEELYQVLSATLEFTSLSAGDALLDRSDFLLIEALEAVSAQWLLKARQKGLQLRLRLNDEIPEAACGDELRLRKLLNHLLSNAVKFTEVGAVDLVANARPDPDNADAFLLDFEVRDTGIGMDQEKVRHIFESFEQLDSGMSRRYPGLGLGLSLAQGITRLMGGELQVESVLGQGSVFRFTIPMGHSSLQPVSPTLTRKLVLVVDDNDASRKVAVAFLKRNQFDVDTAASGREALEQASRRRYDLVLMDLQMPEMDGIESTHRLRQLPGYQSTPVVALTANASQEYRELCLAHGMQGFLTKPVEAEDLIRTVRRVLSQSY